MSDATKPLRLALIGCGAVSERYHAPALEQCAAAGLVEVVHLVDPTAERVATIQKRLPQATPAASVEALAGAVDLAIVASPVRFHAEQVKALLARGIHVLCEKPLARDSAEAAGMIEAAKAADKLLAVGLFRRFFPAIEFIADIVRTNAFGRCTSFHLDEGGRFGWPAVTASFFDKAQSGGGVTMDIGVHMLDIALHWFGEPASFTYGDDAYGGIETNAHGTLHFPRGLVGSFRLSWDVPLSGTYALDFERGWIRWATNSAHSVAFGLDGVRWAGDARLARAQRHLPLGLGAEGPRYVGAFTAQIADVVEAIHEQRAPRVTAESAVAGMSLIERMYAGREVLIPPHFTAAERERALAMARGVSP